MNEVYPRRTDRPAAGRGGPRARHLAANEHNVVRAGDNVHIDLMLGNHGNDHRDFKLAGKIELEGLHPEVLDPDGKRYDIKDRLMDIGYTPKEGYWTVPFAGRGRACICSPTPPTRSSATLPRGPSRAPRPTS